MKARVDNFTEQELRQIVSESCSMREVLRKLGYTNIGSNGVTVQKRLDQYNIDTSHFTGLAKTSIKRCEDNIFIKDSTAAQSTLRRWYLKGHYTEYKCSICGQEPVWNGKELTLTLDHVNGINNDDRLENLRWVCPNCDRQLDTFGARNPNKKTAYNQTHLKNYCIDCGKEITFQATRCVDCYNKSRRTVERPSREELKQLIRNTSFTAIGEKYGVRDNTIRKWCDGYNLPRKTSDIKEYNDQEWDTI